MKKIPLLFMLALWNPSVSLADPSILGQWKTSADKNGRYQIVNVANCGTTICVTVVQDVNAPANQNLAGKIVMRDMERTRPREWRRGFFFDQVYDRFRWSTLFLRENGTLIAKGYRGISVFRQTWSRL